MTTPSGVAVTPAGSNQTAQSVAANQQLATQIAAVLATASTAASAASVLGPAIAGTVIRTRVLEAVLAMVMAQPPEATGFYGTVTRQAAQLNLMRRAQFVIASCRRVTQALTEARSRNQPLGQALAGAISAERRYYGQHLMAMWARSKAAAAIDSAAMLHGRLLGWNTVITPTTTPECLAADRHNFLADQMPPIGWPGLAHPGCRCYPGAPFPGAPLVGSSRPVPARVRVPAYA
jgi:hypothetical protein